MHHRIDEEAIQQNQQSANIHRPIADSRHIADSTNCGSVKDRWFMSHYGTSSSTFCRSFSLQASMCDKRVKKPRYMFMLFPLVLKRRNPIPLQRMWIRCNDYALKQQWAINGVNVCKSNPTYKVIQKNKLKMSNIMVLISTTELVKHRQTEAVGRTVETIDIER